jgi:hypothetical protein
LPVPSPVSWIEGASQIGHPPSLKRIDGPKGLVP